MAREEEESLFEGLDFTGFNEDTEIVSTRESEETETEDKDKEKKKTTTTAEEDADAFFEQEIDETSSEEIDDTKKPTEEDKEDSKKDKTGTPSDNNSSSSFLQVLAKSLYEEGVLSSFDDKTEIKQAADFITLVQNEIVSNVESYKNDLPEEIKTLIDVYEEGVPLNELLNIRSKKIEYGRIDESKLGDNEDVMKQLISDDLTRRGYSEEDIKEKIVDIFALDKGEAEAKKALGALKKHQEKAETELIATEAKRRDDAIKQRDASLLELKETVEKTKEFAGIELTKQHKKEIFDSLTKEVANINGRPVNAITKAQLENPADFQRKLAMAFTLTKGFTDWSSFGKVAKSKTMSELEEQARKAAERIKPGVSVKSTIEETDNTPGGFLKGLKL